MDSINPNFRSRAGKRSLNPAELKAGILKGDRASLSRALTLCESKLAQHRELAEELLQGLMPHTGNSIRIGITGVPGVGKSTFIEAFGKELIEAEHRLAVLAIDPSSGRSKGSILGDKTRMHELSQDTRAFIRPSPSGGSLGGVARRTRESILLCEAAGYDVILVETVGVGQSETAVKNMVDFFMLLMLAGAGDELQGIKRGIMEMADLLLINKADDPKDPRVKLAMGEYKRALHLFPPNPNEWIPKVQACSALQKSGIAEAWEVILSFENQQKNKGYFEAERQRQSLAWFEESIGELVLEQVRSGSNYQAAFQEIQSLVKEGKLEAGVAAHRLVEKLFA
ncbi:methylmalonyl Co-A mutase-associated GTPase MeaB [Croceimicrobium hydrocarbonivorans]|uniref:Methylmalonyl Co-A mutase-associated GTPase MeaB n=1 Tax=Croceimicrobium hydrocarbonivorans TaxID=2761580 RepID=A0A7H0VGJ9_9FLAO|nr:methylmalonyl Co-A mutase-associated GTPase MeaB [Croceimicrobium hydrocarbonivorans]QNR24847.1 methylmalonyl Co-A mutase-associated GTPase MeaB [Croceimicrobium hydrocarbonivorans]